jgi:hypothetical protein
MRLRLTLVATFTAAAAIAVAAQSSPRPPMPPRLDTGDAAIRGRVIDQSTEQPISGALITLAPIFPTAANIVTQSDADGRYAFDHLPAGRFRVTASHPRYVSSVFGAMLRSNAPFDGQVTVERRQSRNDVNFALSIGGGISGRILRHDGEPLLGARLLATLDFGDGGFTILPGSEARTNARGEYTLANLPSGHYRISAFWREGDSGSSINDAPVRSAQMASPPRAVFYPGTTAVHETVLVAVASGRTARNIDIVFPTTELLRVSGKIVRSGTEGDLEAFVMTGPAMQPIAVERDGTFTTPTLRAGRYSIVARVRTDDTLEAAMINLDLSFELKDLVLGLMPTGVIVGRVTTDDGAPVSTEMQVAAVLSDQGRELDDYRRDRSEIGSAGEFRIGGVFGERVMRMVGVTAGWKIARVTVGKREVTTLSAESGETIEDVVIVLTRS